MHNKIICGDVIDKLQEVKNDISILVITSPPYFNQRKYTEITDPKEIGREKTIDEYLSNLYIVFEDCMRVCRPDGSIVFNIGDIYLKKSLQLIPYKFAIGVLERFDVKLINDITWVKTNPTPRQYRKRLVPSTEPFLHFVKNNDYYYNIDAFLPSEKVDPRPISPAKGVKYSIQITQSDLSREEKEKAMESLTEVLSDLRRGKVTDFRMKIRGIHKKAFGGQSGGRNSQIDKQGFTIIRMYGNKLKRDVIESSVANTKNIDHSAVFPLKVITELVYLLSKVDDLVIDPFCGSGQTCFVAKSLNRKYLGIDLNPDFCKLAETRLKEVK